MNIEPYVLIQTEDSFCPKCDKAIRLLTNGEKPMFYICFDCHFVAQVGIGVVEHKELNDGNEKCLTGETLKRGIPWGQVTQ